MTKKTITGSQPVSAKFGSETLISGPFAPPTTLCTPGGMYHEVGKTEYPFTELLNGDAAGQQSSLFDDVQTHIRHDCSTLTGHKPP